MSSNIDFHNVQQENQLSPIAFGVIQVYYAQSTMFLILASMLNTSADRSSRSIEILNFGPKLEQNSYK